MEVSKIHLSSSEIELMQNAEIILTKNRVLEKMKLLLEEVQESQINFVANSNLTNEFFKVSSKISKGENYLGFPYLILDYPRHSSENAFVFIRTMFWWGNFFSCTLHLSGNSKQIFKASIKRSYRELQHYYININKDPWVHHLEETNYRKIGLMTPQEFEQACENFDHIKIAGRHSLSEWEKAPAQLFNNWKFFLRVCGLVA